MRDNGQGFDATKSDFIFEPFKRLHGRDVPGNGIGLATCKRIVEIGKGRILSESDGKDKGATFWFTRRFGRQRINLNLAATDEQPVDSLSAFPADADIRRFNLFGMLKTKVQQIFISWLSGACRIFQEGFRLRDYAPAC